MMIKTKVTDLYYEAEKEIRARENEFTRFIKYEIPKDPKLKKLWLFTFSHNPSDKNYPISKKIDELKNIQPEDTGHIIEKSNSDPDNFIFYRLLLSNLIPLSWSIKVVHGNPDLSLQKILDDARQEIRVEYFDNGRTIKTQTISTEWPNFASIHTVETNQEELCIEFWNEVRFDDILFLENYPFHLFQKKRGDPELQDLLWGKDKAKYFITIINKSKKNTFPAPIFSRHIKLIENYLKDPKIKEKIIQTEMDDDPKTLRASMERRFFKGALKFKGKGSSENYFKKLLPPNDEFKKASTQITAKNKSAKKTRVLRPKIEHSGGSIDTEGKLIKNSNNDPDENKLTPISLQYSNTEDVEWMITLTQIIEFIDDPKEKQTLNLLHEGFTQEEIAKKLNVSQSSVSRFPRKIKKLLNNL